MKTFLESVAADMLQKYKSEMGHTAVVFPNKRAALFLNRAIARLSDGPVWSPAYITISELFRQHSTLTVADPILTIAILHESYTKITGSNEDLDRFFSWGQLLLSDFDDLDKNMGDARKIFRNVSDLHELDTLSYLDENEINILRRFFKNFTADDTLLKEKFLRLWSKMADIYTDFKDNLRRRGLAYEGMLYRDVVEGGEIPYLYERYLFVGFNVIQKVEQRLFSDLKSKGMARFYWDYDRYYIGSGNEAGVYIRQWLDKYPNELRNDDDSIYANMLSGKKIDFVSAPTENLQARFISTWLRENDRYKDGSRTAIVMQHKHILHDIFVHEVVSAFVAQEGVDVGNLRVDLPVFVPHLCHSHADIHHPRKRRERIRLELPYSVGKVGIQGVYSGCKTAASLYIGLFRYDHPVSGIFSYILSGITACRAAAYDEYVGIYFFNCKIF